MFPKLFTLVMILFFVFLQGCLTSPYQTTCVDPIPVGVTYKQLKKQRDMLDSIKAERKIISSADSDIKLLNMYNVEGTKVYYTGDSDMGLANGTGKAVWVYKSDTLEIYDGGFYGGVYSGLGKRHYTYGLTIEGNYEEGFLTGEYTSTFRNGTVINGSVNKGKQDWVTIKYPNGDTYTGLASGTEPDSSGVYVWEDGEQFEGVFSYGKIKLGLLKGTNGASLKIAEKDNKDDLLKLGKLKPLGSNGIKSETPEVDLKVLVSKVVYPCSAKTSGYEATVIVRCAFDIDGSIVKTDFIKPLYIPEEIKQSVLNALYQTPFTVGKQNGKPVKIWMAVPFRFRLR